MGREAEGSDELRSLLRIQIVWIEDVVGDMASLNLHEPKQYTRVCKENKGEKERDKKRERERERKGKNERKGKEEGKKIEYVKYLSCFFSI